MVHTRWGIGQLRGAEVRRGCIFSEPLSSVEGVLKNGGVIGSGAKFVSSKEGFQFSGASGAKISYGDILRVTKPATTMSCWFKCDNSVVTEMMLFGQNDAFGTRIYITNGVLTFYLIVGVAARIVSATGTWNDGQWHHVAGTWSSGDYVKIYVDGKYNAATEVTYTGVCSTNIGYSDFTINSSLLANRFFKGNLRDVKVFNTALDADEIKEYYTNTAFQYKPVLSLPMRIDDHDITNVRTLDRSGYANHATLGDGSTSTTYPTKKTVGDGYTFDGTTDYMQSQSTISFSSCTFGALCRFDAQSLRTVLAHGDTGDLFVLGAGVEGGVGTDNILNFAMYSSSWKVAGSGIIPCIGKIYSLVGTYDGTTLKVYVDGKYLGSNTAAPDNRSFAVRVGRRFAAGTPNYFDGDVFEVFVSSKCLTASQVIDLDMKMRERVLV